eukprot:s3333_g7.t1
MRTSYPPQLYVCFSEGICRGGVRCGAKISSGAQRCCSMFHGGTWRNFGPQGSHFRKLQVQVADLPEAEAQKTLNGILQAASHRSSWTDAAELLGASRQGTLQLNEFCCSSFLGACAKSEAWILALEHVSGWMPCSQIRPDSFCYAAALSTFQRAQQWKLVETLSQASVQVAIQPNIVSFTTAVRAREKWRLAVYSNLCMLRLQVDAMWCSSVLKRCADAGQWRVVLSMLVGMRRRFLTLDEICWNAAMTSQNPWPMTTALLSQSTETRAHDVSSFTQAMNSCTSQLNWRGCCASSPVRLDVFLSSAVINALQKEQLWAAAAGYLQNLLRSTMQVLLIIVPDSLTRSSAIRSVAMSEAFRLAQDKRCESWIADEDLCDFVAFVGPERQRVALYGEFREGHTRELVLEDVTVDAFDVMMRTAYHLEPKLTPARAITALKAAKLYMIEDLEKYCWDYLGDLEGLDSTLILQTLTESLKSSFDLPEELQCTYWSNILSKSASVVQSPFFAEMHGSVIAKLIKLDEFHVNEEALWNRLVEWSASAVQKPELLGPFAAATPCQPAKRVKTNDDDSNGIGPSETAQQEAILQLMSPHMRFIQMSKDFFIDKVRKHLDRKNIDAVTDYFLVGRKSEGLLIEERGGLKDPDVAAEEKQDFQECCDFNQKKLKLTKPILLTKVEIHGRELSHFYGRPQFFSLPFKWSVSAANLKFSNPVASDSKDRMPSKSTISISLKHPCDELIVEIPSDQIEKVHSIHVTGRNFKPPVELAKSVVQRLSKDLLVKPTEAKNDPDQ